MIGRILLNVRFIIEDAFCAVTDFFHNPPWKVLVPFGFTLWLVISSLCVYQSCVTEDRQEQMISDCYTECNVEHTSEPAEEQSCREVCRSYDQVLLERLYAPENQ